LSFKTSINALQKFPDSVHVLEDMGQIFRDRGAQGVLRSALWGQRREGDKGPMERQVTWSTYRKEHTFVFTGGVIMLANLPLHDLPQLDAIRTRIAYMHLEVSDREMRALMRKVASCGYQSEGRRVEPAVCQEICERLIRQSLDMHRVLDMRLLVNCLEDRLQWEEADSGCHWTDLVDSRIRERPTYFRGPVTMAAPVDRKRQELAVVREIVAATGDRQERLRIWQERTGKSEQTLYRRIAQIKQEEAFSP
jgi:hypothetical protein